MERVLAWTSSSFGCSFEANNAKLRLAADLAMPRKIEIMENVKGGDGEGGKAMGRKQKDRIENLRGGRCGGSKEWTRRVRVKEKKEKKKRKKRHYHRIRTP